MGLRSTILADEEDDVQNAEFVVGVDEAKEKVSRYLEKIADSEVADVDLMLGYLGRGESKPFESWGWSPATGEDHNAVADVVIDRAVEEASQLDHGRVRFRLWAKQVKTACQFHLELPEKDEDDVDEEPNNKGVMHLLMRLTDKMSTKLVEVTDSSQRFARDRERRLMDENEQLRSAAVQNIAVFHQMQDASHLHKLEVRRLELEEERRGEVTGMLMTSGQVAMNRLLGEKKFDKQTTMVEQLVYAFMSSLSKEQVEGVVSGGQLTLASHQALAFLQLLSDMQDHLQRVKGAPPPAPPGGPGEPGNDGGGQPAAPGGP